MSGMMIRMTNEMVPDLEPGTKLKFLDLSGAGDSLSVLNEIVTYLYREMVNGSIIHVRKPDGREYACFAKRFGFIPTPKTSGFSKFIKEQKL